MNDKRCSDNADSIARMRVVRAKEEEGDVPAEQMNALMR